KRKILDAPGVSRFAIPNRGAFPMESNEDRRCKNGKEIQCATKQNAPPDARSRGARVSAGQGASANECHRPRAGLPESVAHRPAHWQGNDADAVSLHGWRGS